MFNRVLLNKVLCLLALVLTAGLIVQAAAGPARAEASPLRFNAICRTGTPGELAEAIAAGADVNAACASGITPLMALSFDQGEAAMEKGLMLLKAGADPSLPGRNGDTPLHLAARNGPAAWVKALLEAGAQVNASNMRGDTPLMMFFRNRPEVAVEKADMLLKAGADAAVVNKCGETALHLAAKYGQVLMVEVLLEAGMEVNIPDLDGNTILHLAADYGSGILVQALLSAGADPTRANKRGETALHLAVKYGQTSLTKSLLEAGAETNANSKNGYTPLMLLAGGRAEISENAAMLLKAGADPSLKNKRGETALHLAAESGPVSLVKALLEARAQVNARDQRGFSPLMHASQGAYSQSASPDKDLAAEKALLLLEAGADPALADQTGITALHLAAATDQPSLTEALLKAGADGDARDKAGRSPLHFAVLKGAPAVAAKLLEAGATVDMGGDFVKTPLYWTQRYWNASRKESGEAVIRLLLANGAMVRDEAEPAKGRPLMLTRAVRQNLAPDIIELLVKAGAGVNQADLKGYTALMAAAARGSGAETVRVLLKAGAEVNRTSEDGATALMAAVSGSGPETVEMLLKAGAEVNCASERGITALVLAASHDKPEVVKMLLAAGAEVNRADSGGGTALVIAALSSEPEMVKMLLEAGAEVTQANQDGTTALIAAAEDSRPYTVEVLLMAGAKVNWAGSDGETALMAAARNYNLETLRILLMAGADPNQTDRSGYTTLDKAVNGPRRSWREERFEGTIRLLLEGGATVRGRAGAAGASPQTLVRVTARGATEKGVSPDIIELLIRAGAEVNQVDETGSTALIKAAKGARPEAVLALLKAGADPNLADMLGHTALSEAAGKNTAAAGEIRRMLEEAVKK